MSSLRKRPIQDQASELNTVRVKQYPVKQSLIESLRQQIEDLSRRLAEQESLNQELLERQEHLGQLAYNDSLTGLHNRALFIDHLNLALQRSKRYKDNSFAVLFIDLDYFKSINDSLGHASGDQLLITVAQRLQGGLRRIDIISRLGGDEFAVLLDKINRPSDAMVVAESILQQVSAPIDLQGRQIFITASIGIALSSEGYERAEDMMRDADVAMHRAKKLGRARAEMYDESMHAQTLSVLQVRGELRRAIERVEFCNYYQPIFSLKENELVGFEALIRWQHPERGLVPPMEFIPLAEDTGLIIPIGFFVLEDACNKLKEWQSMSPEYQSLSMSVNLSGKQLNHPELVREIETIIGKSGIKPECLKLEITESVVMENASKATAILKDLRALGVSLCIDDFGTGYSSLSYLRRFPIDVLKVDRSFVSRMSMDREDHELVRTIINLAHLLNMEVVAEGIETTNQRILLRAMKCEYGQGYLYSKPLSREDAVRFMQDKYHM